MAGLVVMILFSATCPGWEGSAASVASSLRVSYTGVQIALVVGICGGVPYPSDGNYAEIFLGDVIISDAVVEYDFWQAGTPSGFQRKMDGHKDILGGPDRKKSGLFWLTEGEVGPGMSLKRSDVTPVLRYETVGRKMAASGRVDGYSLRGELFPQALHSEFNCYVPLL